MLKSKSIFPLLTAILILILCLNSAGAAPQIEVYSGAIEEGDGYPLVNSLSNYRILATEALSIDSFTPAWNEIEIGGNQTGLIEFSIAANQACTINWYVNGALEKTEESSGYSSFLLETAAYPPSIYEIRAEAVKNSETVERAWTLRIYSEYYYRGSRIWDENAGLSDDYTWDYLSYSGFFYDLNSGLGSESMTISGISDGNIEENDLVYSTVPIETDFEYRDWGSYQVIGFLGEKYFAGYEDDRTEPVDDDVSLIHEGILSRVLTDSDENKSVHQGSTLVLEDGYSLNIVESNVNGDTVWVQLEKDGDVVEDQFLSSGSDFVYETDLGDAEDVPIIIAHFGTVFAEQENSAVFVEGIFQISDNCIEINAGDIFGEMEVSSMSSTKIKMENEDDINLEKGDIIDLMGKIKIQVADDDALRFAPVQDMSKAGIYELRGTVYDEEGKQTIRWDPLNFEGFYYDIDEGVGTETFEITDLSGNEIPENNLIYTITADQVEFEYDDWGEFQVIGFMGKDFFAGFSEDNTTFIDSDVNLLSEGILSKVLINSYENRSIYSGSTLVLEEGYALEIQEVDINGDTVWVQLQKDGDAVEDAFLASGETYVYENDMGDAENIPQIIVHFGTVFAGQETSGAFIEGIFQISDDYIELRVGDNFGEMEIKTLLSKMHVFPLSSGFVCVGLRNE